ncbi:MAG: phosphomannomutase [Halobacteriales archaeon]
MSLFGTAGIRGDVTEAVTPELALSVGRAAGTDARRRGDEEFVVARDGRTSGQSLADAVSAGLASAGARVVRAGVLPTPALAFASTGRRGIMVTASHNPPTDNGLKLFADGTEYDRNAEKRVADLAGEQSPAAWSAWRGAERASVIDRYCEAIVAYAETHGATLEGTRIAVDPGNGTAGLATPRVLRALGGEVVALNANVHGAFPARPSKPTPETLAEFRSFVDDDDAAFGIAHDGDGDRIVIVDPDGAIVHEDTIVAILAAHYTRESGAADPVVVTTPNASGRIDERVVAAGGRVERVRLGALHEGIAAVRDAGKEDTAVAFAAEPWKHVHPALGGWIDGVASAAVLARLVAAVGSIGALREPVTERPYRKDNVRCPDDRKSGAMERITKTLPARFPEATVKTDHGVRIDLPDGSWVLVRPSGTEPYLRVYAESDSVDDLIEEAMAVVERAVSA